MYKLLFQIYLYTTLFNEFLRFRLASSLTKEQKNIIKALIRKSKLLIQKSVAAIQNYKMAIQNYKMTIQNYKRAIRRGIRHSMPPHLTKQLTIRNKFTSGYVSALLSMHRNNVLVRYVRLADAYRWPAQITVLSKWVVRPCAYKHFEVFGKDVDLCLKGGRYFSQHDVHTVSIRDAVLNGYVEGALKSGRLWSLIEMPGAPFDFGCFHRSLKPLGKQSYLVRPLSLMPRRMAKVIFFAGNFGYASNYFHFMVDALPSLLLSIRTVRKRPDASQFKVLLPIHLHPNIQHIIRRVCQHFNMPVVDFSPNHTLKCDEVIMTGYPSYMANALPKAVNYSVSPVITRYTRWVLNAVFHATSDLGERFYITRKDSFGASTTRHVANYQEISDTLAGHAFKTIAAQEMTFEQQLNVFQSAKVIVFDGGASLANLVFSRKCKYVAVLAMRTGTDPSMFVSFCQSLGITISYIGGPLLPGQEFVESWQRSYTIEPRDILIALAKHQHITTS